GHGGGSPAPGDPPGRSQPGTRPRAGRDRHRRPRAPGRTRRGPGAAGGGHTAGPVRRGRAGRRGAVDGVRAPGGARAGPLAGAPRRRRRHGGRPVRRALLLACVPVALVVLTATLRPTGADLVDAASTASTFDALPTLWWATGRDDVGQH